MARQRATKAKPVKAPKEKKPSTPKPKAAKAARPRSGAAVQPPVDVYTLMLLFAFLAILAACVFLYLDSESYGTNKRPTFLIKTGNAMAKSTMTESKSTGDLFKMISA